MFPWFLRTFDPVLWFSLALVWTLVWRRAGEPLRSMGVTFGLGLVAMLPLQAMTLQFLTVDEGGIGVDLLGRYPMTSVNFGGFKISYLVLRPISAFFQVATDWSDDLILRVVKGLHTLLGAGLFGLAFRILPHQPAERRRMQMLACLGFLTPSIFFANKILNYDAISNGFSLVSTITCWRYWQTGHRSWAVAAFLSAALGFAEKVTALPFLIVALVALGWSTTGRARKELWRVYAFAFTWLVAPVLLVILQMWTLSFGGTLGRAVSDSFGGLLVWTMPLRNFGFIKALLGPVWARAVFSLVVLGALLWLPGWPALRNRVRAGLDFVTARDWENRGQRFLRLGLVTTVLLGLVAPHLVSPLWMAPHNVAPGVVTTTPLNGWIMNFDTTSPVKHAVSYFLTCCWQLSEWWPTILLGAVIVPFFVGSWPNRRLAYWLLLCGLGYLLFFVLTRNPPGHRYVAPGGVVMVVGVLLVLGGFVSRYRPSLQYAILAGCIGLAMLDLGRYWPCSGAFRPAAMVYPVSEEVEFADAKAPWLGWGEEAALAAHIMRERRAAGQEVQKLYLAYGRLLGFNDVPFEVIKLNAKVAVEGGRASDWVLINRTMRLLQPRPVGEPIFVIRYDGWPVAWVYRLGEVFPEVLP
jgi:hypothetical protein